jgi:hypothetical protein
LWRQHSWCSSWVSSLFTVEEPATWVSVRLWTSTHKNCYRPGKVRIVEGNSVVVSYCQEIVCECVLIHHLDCLKRGARCI